MDSDNDSIYEKVEDMIEEQNKNQLNKIKEELNIVLIDLNDKIQSQKIIKIISSIISFILSIYSNKIEETKNLYESLIQRDEQTIRILYKNLLTQKLMKESLDNKIRLLLTKEREYEIVKEKTGAYFKDGQLIYNKQKDNEIIILRQENSNLKNIVEYYEKLIKEKDSKYENLYKKYNNIRKNLSSMKKTKKISIPNVDINLNDSHRFINTEKSNNCGNSIVKGKNLSTSKLNKKDNSNFNYIKYKNISKMNNIPLNNCLTSRNLQSSVDNINQKEILRKKKTNSKIKEETKLLLNSDSQNESCSLKKWPLKINDIFNSKKNNQLNLLKAYTSGSYKNINKFNISKKLSNYFKEELTTSYYHNNYNTQKANSNSKKKISNKKKISQNSSETENLQKSYISSIPYNNERKNKYLRKEMIKFKFAYSKTKRENENDKNRSELYVNKNWNKKYGDIDTKKIFLQTSFKKGELS